MFDWKHLHIWDGVTMVAIYHDANEVRQFVWEEVATAIANPKKIIPFYLEIIEAEPHRRKIDM